MKKYFKILAVTIKMSIMREMEYRINFAMISVQAISFIFFNLLFYRAILDNIGSIGSWAYSDMVVLFGTYTIVDGMFMTFIILGVNSVEMMVRTGTLDSYLVKPLDSQFMISAGRGINFDESPSILFGLFVVFYGLSLGHYSISMLSVLAYLSFIVVSVMIFYSLSLIFGCIVFVIEKAEELNEIIFSFKQFSKFPDIYNGPVRYLLMMFLPIVFASFVPSAVLLGKTNIGFMLYYFVISILFLILSRIVWKGGLKKYKSAGG